MQDELEQLFLAHSIAKLDQYTERIKVCLEKLTEDRVWARGSANENAIGNLVLHLCGNVRQWIVAGVGGRPDIRERDREFAAGGGIGIAELLERLRATVAEANSVIRSLDSARLVEHRTIQNYHVSVFEAVYHVVEHFSMHTGQIIFATKMLTGTDLGFYAELRGNGAGDENRTRNQQPGRSR